tara:strand:- start:183 stop:392 length:210 start_codon:yes stop_codon:yes gene_type:complete
MTLETKLFIIALVFVSPVIYFVAAFLLLFKLLRNDVSSNSIFYNTKPLVGKRMGGSKDLFRNFGMALPN